MVVNLMKINRYDIFGMALFLYIVSAIAFECTQETARISTIAIYIVFILGIINIVSERYIQPNLYIYSSILLCLFAFVMTFAPNASQSMGTTSAYWLFTCTALIVVVYFNVLYMPSLVRIVIVSNIIGVAILSFRIILTYGGLSAMMQFASNIEGERRVGSLLLNANQVGLYMANAMLCCLLLILQSKKLCNKIGFGACAIFFSTMCLMAGSKKAVTFIVVGFLVMLFCYSKNLRIGQRILLCIVVAIIIVGVINSMNTLPIFNTLSVRLEELINTLRGEGKVSSSDLARIEFTRRGLEAFNESPIFGKGTAHSYTLFGTYSHNNFVELLMNFGVVGFLLYYIPVISLIKGLVVRMKSRDIMVIYLFSFVLLQLILGVGWVNYYERVVQVIIATAWAYISNGQERMNINEN